MSTWRRWILLAVLSAPGPLCAQVDSTAAPAIGHPLARGVGRVIAGLPYRVTSASGGPDTLVLDAYLPDQLPTGERRAVVMFVHGGLIPGDPDSRATAWPVYQAWGRLAAASGFVGVIVNHRLTINENYEVASDDVHEALEYVRQHSPQITADPNRICVAMFSGSGPLATPFLAGIDQSVRCVVLMYPYLDLEHLRVPSPFRDAIASNLVDSLEGRFSPSRIVQRDSHSLPPIFLGVGATDASPGLNASVQRFLAAALAGRVNVDAVVHRDGGHGFEARNHDARTRQILDHLIAFLHRHLDE